MRQKIITVKYRPKDNTGCVTKMYPIFESKWLITFSKLRRGFYTVVKKMKFYAGLYKPQLSNVNNFDTVRSPK